MSTYTFSPERKTTDEEMAQSSQVKNSMEQEISLLPTMKATGGIITLSSPEQKISDKKKALSLPERKSTCLCHQPCEKVITQPLYKKKLFDNENTSSSLDQNASDKKNTPSLLEQESSDSRSSPEQDPEQDPYDKKSAPSSFEPKTPNKNAPFSPKLRLPDKKNGSSSPKQNFPDGKLSLSSHSNGLIHRNNIPHIKVVCNSYK